MIPVSDNDSTLILFTSSKLPLQANGAVKAKADNDLIKSFLLLNNIQQ